MTMLYSKEESNLILYDWRAVMNSDIHEYFWSLKWSLFL